MPASPRASEFVIIVNLQYVMRWWCLRMLSIKVGDAVVDQFRVSAALLSVSSSWFKILMFGPMREGRENEIEISMDSPEGESACTSSPHFNICPLMDRDAFLFIGRGGRATCHRSRHLQP